METVYIESRPLMTSYLRWLGTLLLHGVTPVHTKLYWTLNRRIWMTELTSVAPKKVDTEIVGTGDDYTIQISPVQYAPGQAAIPGADATKIRALAESYASVVNGDLNGFIDLDCERDWFRQPQGYGGPTYGECTSNTYVAWILRQICPVVPASPKGALGWDRTPSFPGPRIK